ncbi:MAG: FecR domain-containing protein [Saprospiraceae bacterium]|nr:FecR domain-containing protein [Saprospiraceae bacterium]
MNKEENIILVKWLDSSATIQELAEISEGIDLDVLRQDLAYIDNLKLKAKPIEQSWEDFQQKRDSNAAKKGKFKYLLLGFIFILIIGFVHLAYQNIESNKVEEIKTKVGEKYAGWLPDSSAFHLNALTSLSYLPSKWQVARTLNLSGQAYFDVKKGSSFLVQTNDGFVKVLGTKFDVESYGIFMNVTCYEGKVEVNAGQNKTKIIHASQQVSVRNGNFYDFKNVNDISPSWRDNRLKFENIPLKNVLTELKKYYDFDFEMKTKYQTRYYTGQIPTNDIQKSMELIFDPLDIPFELKDKRLVF